MVVVTKGKRFQAIRRRLRAANARFKKLTKGQQRIAIAKDVISQIRLRRFRAASTYLHSPAKDDVGWQTPRPDDLDVGEVLCQSKCDVCGIGSLFVSAVQKADNLPFKDFATRGYVRDAEVEYLRKWFPDEMLNTIEDYYEVNVYYQDHPILEEKSNNKRLIMIMENIISNGGKFLPHKGANSR